MDEKIEKNDDDSVKITKSTETIVDVSALKEALVEAQASQQALEDYITLERVARQAITDAAQTRLDKASAAGVSVSSAPVEEPINEETP